jgi:hypothetical protein
MKIHDDISKMGMTDLTYNQFFVKDREAWYRDFEREISALDLVREIISNNTDINIDINQDDESLMEELFYLTQHGTESLDGVIAMYNNAMWGMASVRAKLIESMEFLRTASYEIYSLNDERDTNLSTEIDEFLKKLKP